MDTYCVKLYLYRMPSMSFSLPLSREREKGKINLFLHESYDLYDGQWLLSVPKSRLFFNQKKKKIHEYWISLIQIRKNPIKIEIIVHFYCHGKKDEFILNWENFKNEFHVNLFSLHLFLFSFWHRVFNPHVVNSVEWKLRI